MKNRLDNAKYKAIRKLILLRDGNCCVKCSTVKNLQIHHVDDHCDHTAGNLETLCYWCHLIAPNGAEYWEWKPKGDSGPLSMAKAAYNSTCSNIPFGIVLRLTLSLLDAIPTVEALTSERTREGLERARRKGVQFGRPPLTVDRSAMLAMRQGGASIRQIAHAFKVSRGFTHKVIKGPMDGGSS